jgi:peptidoglycan/xylan/chitin deacetylase (PgdA/CDA1 family)
MSVKWRDDDVLYTPQIGIDVGTINYLERFIDTDRLLEQYGVIHEVALLAKGIDENTAWVNYIKAHPHIHVQLHGWEHIDYTKNHDRVREDIVRSLDKIEATFGVRPPVWFPPWNRTDEFCNQVCSELGLIPSPNKISLSDFVARPTDNVVINFHYWASCDTDYLEAALKVYKERYA